AQARRGEGREGLRGQAAQGRGARGQGRGRARRAAARQAVMSPRLIAAGVVMAVGGSLWAVLPDNPGSLRDESTAVHWTVPKGRALAAWVLVRNTGPDRLTLRALTLDVPAGARLLGLQVR